MSACTAHICTICLLCTHTQCLNVYINIVVHCTMLVHSRSDRACVHVTNHEMYMYINNVYTVYTIQLSHAGPIVKLLALPICRHDRL